MKNFWLRLSILLAAVFVMAGCATDLRISGVSVSVTDLRPVNATVFETEAALSLRYANESVVPIAVSGSTHKLYLNGTYVGKSVSKDPVGLPSLNTATQTVTLYIENLALLRKLQELDRTSVISYTLESVLLVEAGEAYDKVKLKSSGQLDLGAFGPRNP